MLNAVTFVAVTALGALDAGPSKHAIDQPVRQRFVMWALPHAMGVGLRPQRPHDARPRAGTYTSLRACVHCIRKQHDNITARGHRQCGNDWQKRVHELAAHGATIDWTIRATDTARMRITITR